MRNQRGMALPVTLMVMVAIGGLTLGLLTLSSVEPRVAKNLEEATQARFAAEAGLEWGYNFLAQNTSTWSTSLASATASTGATLVAGQAIGTLNAARGTYTVVLRNDHRNNDNLLTGVSPIEGSHNADGNGVVILTATGGIGNATKTIRAVVRKTQFPNGFFPGALNFPGNEAEVTFSGGTFNIDGRGYHTDGTLDSGCASAYGIAVSSVLPANNPGANEAAVEGKLSGTQQDNVKGQAQDPSQTAEGNNTIVANPVLTPAYINQFINQAKASADITLESHQPSGLSYNDIGSACASDWASQSCWGTADNPKTIWIKGDADPTSMFSALTLNGPTTGHGVLIVEDGDFRIYGDFTWHGAIIVTGNWVGVGFLGGGTQTVYGAVISNETSTDPGFKEGVVTGNAKIRYSCDALNNSLNNPKLVRLTNWKDLAPGE